MSRWFVLLATLIMAASTASGSAWAVGDLKTALIRGGETPPSFGASHVKAYHHFVKKMSVTSGKQGSGKGTASCDLPASFARDGWTQGIIQSFDGPSILSAYELCASMFASTAGTHIAFLYQLAAVAKEAKKQPGLKVKTISRLGAEAAAVGGSQQGFTVWILTFRKDNAIIDLSYLGPATYGYKDLLQEAHRIDNRVL